MELALYPTTQQRQGCSGVVVENNPAEDATITTTATTSCLQQQNIVLDDGYGSSNSSPHSSGTVKLVIFRKSNFIFHSLNTTASFFVVQSDGNPKQRHTLGLFVHTENMENIYTNTCVR
jgi:hypothetical protein